MLNAHDKVTIRMIDQQVKELNKRGCSDTDMLKTLSDFVPDVKYIIKAAGAKELNDSFKEAPFFHYFFCVVQGKKKKPKI